jgi:hypothetical protein
MQLVDKSRGTLALRMDDRKQRVIVHTDEDEGPSFYGWEVTDARALDELAAHLERNGVKVARGSRALADERRVQGFDRFLRSGRQPAGSLLRRRGRFRSVQARPLDLGFPHRPARHGPCGAHRGTARGRAAVLHRNPQLQADRLFLTEPFKAYFFHLNPRHHSLAFIDTGKNGIHHLMVELCYLDDVGQGYDLALRKPEMIGTTLGRHVNDHVTSFYSWSPSKFLVEYGWGGRTIDTANWTPQSAPKARACGATTANG